MPSKTFSVTLCKDDSACFIPIPFDPKAIFGKVRAPVRVTLNEYSYSSTIASMGGRVCIPLRKSHREAARLQGNETLEVTLASDPAERIVELPGELLLAMTKDDRQRWDRLSFTRRKEHAESITRAKMVGTRQRNIERVLENIRAIK